MREGRAQSTKFMWSIRSRYQNPWEIGIIELEVHFSKGGASGKNNMLFNNWMGFFFLPRRCVTLTPALKWTKGCFARGHTSTSKHVLPKYNLRHLNPGVPPTLVHLMAQMAWPWWSNSRTKMVTLSRTAQLEINIWSSSTCWKHRTTFSVFPPTCNNT